MEIDVRNDFDSPVTRIRWDDEGVIYQDGETDDLLVLQDEECGSICHVFKGSIDDLIRALEKAKEVF